MPSGRVSEAGWERCPRNRDDLDQYDAESGQTTTFPYQFTGLSAPAIEVLKEAAKAEQQLIAQSKVAN